MARLLRVKQYWQIQLKRFGLSLQSRAYLWIIYIMEIIQEYLRCISKINNGVVIIND